MSITKTDWGSQSKIEARKATIIEPYVKHFKRKNIPNNTEYWSMCGRCATPEGTLVPGCELDYLTKEGLITPDQFHGVELSGDIHEDNSKLQIGNFHNGMFQFAIQSAKNPTIVNFDHHRSIKTIKPELKGLFYSLRNFNNFLLVINILMKYRTVEDDKDYIDTTLASSNGIHDYRCISIYSYEGVRDTTQTHMISYSLVKG
jgi:hypothetical protein